MDNIFDHLELNATCSNCGSHFEENIISYSKDNKIICPTCTVRFPEIFDKDRYVVGLESERTE